MDARLYVKLPLLRLENRQRGLTCDFPEISLAVRSADGAPHGVPSAFNKSLLSQDTREHRKEDRYKLHFLVSTARGR